MPKLSLGSRIFLMTVMLIALAMGGAIMTTLAVGRGIANDAVQEAVSKSHSVQSSFQQKRFEQLSLISRYFASDPFIAAYMAEAAEDRDKASILDQLYQRQEDLGFDFAIVLDADGRVLARTDDPDAVGEDLADRPLVSEALEDNEAIGVWEEDGSLYNAVAVPLVRDFDLFGYLISGYAIDENFAREVRSASFTEIAFLAPRNVGSELLATTLSPGAAGDLLTELGKFGPLEEVLASSEKRVLSLDGDDWIVVAAPLRRADDAPVGATLALASLDQEMAPYRRILRTLASVGLLSMVAAFLLSFALSKMTMRPVQKLLAAAEAAREGDYDQTLGIRRSDEVGRVAAAFDGLLSELREKKDMETYISDLSRNLPEPAAQSLARSPMTRDVILLAIENRSLANPNATSDPSGTMERFTKDVHRITAVVTAARGRIESAMGHRVLVTFDGIDGARRAVSAAGQIMSQLSTAENAFEEVEAPVLALTFGEVVSGSLVIGQQTAPAMAGVPMRQLESLLREGNSGDIVLSSRLHDEVRGALAAAGVQIAPQRGLLSPQPIFVLDTEKALTLIAEDSDTLGLPTLDSSVLESRGGVAIKSADLGPGTVLGDRFEIVSLLGAGGMGFVYKAVDRELGDFVALKMLKRQVYGDKAALDSLKTELKLARRVTHQNIVRTFDFGDFGGQPFISMEYVRGLTLRYMLDQTGRLPHAAGLRLARQLCAGLSAAHAEGVVHRDIKPENIILQPSGDAKLMDFGIALPVSETGTQAGLVAGTPNYIAPEVLRGQEPDPRADLYAVGMVLYEIFTGRMPFEAKTVREISRLHLEEPPLAPSSSWPGIPPELEKLILRLLEKDPGKRLASVGELAKVLDRLTA